MYITCTFLLITKCLRCHQNETQHKTIFHVVVHAVPFHLMLWFLQHDRWNGKSVYGDFVKHADLQDLLFPVIQCLD